MGDRTLEEFREDLSLALGQPGVSNRWLDRRVNAGYFNVATASKHRALECLLSTSTVVGETDLLLPARLLGIRSVTDTTNERQLIKFDARNLGRLSLKEKGEPTFYDWLTNMLVVWPPPDGVFKLEILATLEPSKLAASLDKTIIPSMWDDPISVFAESDGFFKLNRRQEGTETFERAVRLVQSRIPEPEWEAGGLTAPALPVRDLGVLAKAVPQLPEAS